MIGSKPSKAISTVSLAVTTVLVVVMAVWGYNALTAPIADDEVSVSAPAEDDVLVCGAGETLRTVRFLRNPEVVVSVYNAGKRKGRATATLTLLENAGFRPGAIGNATGSSVKFVEVRAKQSDATKADLVALSFGKRATVVIDAADELAGPGVNVIIGDRFRTLQAGAPKRIALPEPITECS